MKFTPRANAHQRRETFRFAVPVFWVVMTLVSFAIVLSEKQNLRPWDFLVLAGMGLVGALLFGAVVSVLQPSIALPNLGLDDGEDGLGIPSRLIPPSPVLGARAFPDSDEENA
jgi:hypothetical protein